MDIVKETELWNVFLDRPYTIIYVVERDTEVLKGIISLGDYVKHCREKRELINRKFTKLNYESISSDKQAEVLFMEKAQLVQIPVVDDAQRLLGAYDREKKSHGDVVQEEYWKGLIKQYLKICQREVIIPMEEIAVKLLKLKYTQVFSMEEIGKEAEDFFRVYNALIELRRRNISVCFFERPRLAALDSYSDKARYRIENQLSFVKMVEEPDKYQDILKNFLKTKYSREYIEDLCRIPPILQKGNGFAHIEWKSRRINVVNGRRITMMQPESFEHSIYMYGRCGVFGYAVEDSDTIPSALQKRIVEAQKPYRVVNCGLWGAGSTQIIQNIERDIPSLKDGDRIILYMESFTEEEMFCLKHLGMQYYDCTERYYKDMLERELFYDKPGHMTARGYDVIAEYMWKNLQVDRNRESLYAEAEQYEKVSLPKIKDAILESKIEDYIEKIRGKYPIDYNKKTIGAIVMNCNPFTRGHYYLIESSAQKVDYLFVFVVEEDKSFFPFCDRLRMVQEGVRQLENVLVEPSGQFMIAQETFPEYFYKEQLKDIRLDASKDLELFGKYIAPGLNISIRFAGEEPFDPLTKQYNDAMRENLPMYHICFQEIPRKKQGENVISASIVRKIINHERNDAIEQYVPKTTYDYLIEKGFIQK